MRAAVIDRFGGPEVFDLRDIEKPAPGAGEVLVRIMASGTNPVDAKLRASGSWAGLEPPVVLGYDASGVIEAVGRGVTGVAVGDPVYYTPEIFGNRLGTYAEYNVVPAAIVAPKPPGLTHAEAAAMPLAGGTAYEGLVRRLRLEVGETVLIHGGAGGVGSFAVQIARAAGARVLASASAANLELVRQLGADVAIDYRAEDPAEVALRETGGRGVDAVFDCVGGDLVARSLQATRPFGRLATILGPQGDLRPLNPRNQTLHGVFLTRERPRLEALTRLVVQRKLRPVVDAVLDLADVHKAHERLDTGHGRGKVVLEIARA